METRHNPSGFQIPIPSKDFSAYIAETEKNIKKATKGELKQKWIDARLPFEYQPNKEKCGNSKPSKGVLLIHGLTDSPFLMRDLGKIFKENCFWVRSILLPGHGTVPGDLLNIKYSQWVEATDSGIDSFSGIVDDLYIAGFSTGASLSLHHVLRKKNPKNIKGLILISPGIKENTSLGFVAGFIGSIGKFIPKAGWLDLLPDEDKVKYESFSANAGAQFHYLAKELRQLAADNPPITTPIYMAISSADATVDPYLGKDFFCNHTKNEKNKLLWYSGVETTNEDNVKNCTGGIIKHQKIDDEILGVLTYAHLSLPIDPSNDYYGEKGEYKNCLAYTYSDDKLKICKQEIDINSKVKYGEKSDKNEGNPVRRLTFNPEFKSMVDDIFSFIQNLDK
ncbi:MAG: hypothetical protein HOK41_05890 [Nitrospina sp.]|nr:hypothetical protein [Nitrospina sp.]